MRLLYSIVLHDPHFISRLKKYCTERGLPMSKFWLMMSILRDTDTNDEFAPQLLEALAKEKLLDGKVLENLFQQQSKS